jgi:hypothetical protein
MLLTHLDVPTASNYLRQISRTLRPSGRAILSFHAIPAHALRAEGGVTPLLGVGEGERAYRFRNRGDGYYTHCDEKGAPKNHYLSDPIGDPVAYEIETFISLCAKANLKILEILPRRGRVNRIVAVGRTSSFLKDDHLASGINSLHTWKTDLAMSNPIVVIVCMDRSSESWEP